MRPFVVALSLVAFVAISPARAADPPKLELKDGDRIVYLGNTFAERDQSYGYLETLLTIGHPDISFTFRNLGWSGDTVWGDARARFGTRADGFAHLKEHVLALKPTVILVAYGMNESFARQEGLKPFEEGLNTLLNTLGETKARIALISPMPLENLGPPLPEPSSHNLELGRYIDVMNSVARRRNLPFIDLRRSLLEARKLSKPSVLPNLTDDGLHPTEFGYAILDMLLEPDLFVSRRSSRRIFSVTEAKAKEGWEISNLVDDGKVLKFDAIAEMLPSPRSSDGKLKPHPGGTYISFIHGLKSGKYRLKIDGHEIQRFDVDAERTLVVVNSGPEADQVEKLLAVINAKNELYFHRWRPQNETYLFGFRKHEQGNNSVEIPQFDPLIAEKEAEIARLKKPVKHTYELIREEAGK